MSAGGPRGHQPDNIACTDDSDCRHRRPATPPLGNARPNIVADAHGRSGLFHDPLTVFARRADRAHIVTSVRQEMRPWMPCYANHRRLGSRASRRAFKHGLDGFRRKPRALLATLARSRSQSSSGSLCIDIRKALAVNVNATHSPITLRAKRDAGWSRHVHDVPTVHRPGRHIRERRSAASPPQHKAI